MEQAEWALGLAELRGWFIIPLWGVSDLGGGDYRCDCGKFTCDSAGKHPLHHLVPRGLKQATRDVVTIRGWFQQWPNANYGIVAGMSRLLILDLDGQEGIDSWADMRDRFKAPEPVVVRTFAGVHLYYTTSIMLPPSVKKLAPGIDIRAGESYVVGPGSRHQSGQVYELMDGPDKPDEAPKWLTEALIDLKQRQREAGIAPPLGRGEVYEGERDNWLTSIAGALVRQGIVGPPLLEALRTFNAYYPARALPDEDMVRIARSVERYADGGEADRNPFLDPRRGIIEGWKGERDLPSPDEIAVLEETSERVLRTDLGSDEGYADIVEAMAGQDGVHYVPGLGWMAWDGDRWRTPDEARNGECVIRDWLVAAAEMFDAVKGRGAEAAQAKAQRLRLERYRRPGLNRLALRSGVRTKADEWDVHDRLVGLPHGQGVIELRDDGSWSTRKAVPGDRITRQLGVRYDPDADAPLWNAFLDCILPNAEIRDYVQRWCGYFLHGSKEEQKFGLLYGHGSNGKSTLTDTIRTVMGSYAHELVAGTLVSSRHDAGEMSSIAQLRGTRLTTTTEPKEGGKLNEELIKRITGERDITAKLMRQDPLTFKQTAKVWIATNHRPAVEGTDEGIWRRLRTIPFTTYLEKEQRDLKLLDKLTGTEGFGPGELAGILNWMLEGYQRWREVGLEEPDAVSTASEQYRKTEDVFGDFLETYYHVEAGDEENPDVGVACTVLIAQYGEWCQENFYTPDGKRAINAELEARGHLRLQRRRANKREWYYTGLQALSGVRRTASGATLRALREDALIDGAET